jgi:hypothetical protein
MTNQPEKIKEKEKNSDKNLRSKGRLDIAYNSKAQLKNHFELSVFIERDQLYYARLISSFFSYTRFV